MFWQLQSFNIPPDVIFTPFGFPITNTLFCSWITIVLVIIVVYFGTRKRNLIPSGFQNFVEWGVEGILNLVVGVVGKEKAKKFFPLVGTFFFFALFAKISLSASPILFEGRPACHPASGGGPSAQELPGSRASVTIVSYPR